jgi:hypothetical protein
MYVLAPIFGLGVGCWRDQPAAVSRLERVVRIERAFAANLPEQTPGSAFKADCERTYAGYRRGEQKFRLGTVIQDMKVRAA